jgi:hypothetical protein
MELITALGPEVLAVESQDSRIPKKALEVGHLLGGEILECFPCLKIAEADTALALQRTLVPVEDHGVIGSGETSRNPKSDLHATSAGNRNRVPQAALDGGHQDGESQNDKELLHHSHPPAPKGYTM